MTEASQNTVVLRKHATINVKLDTFSSNTSVCSFIYCRLKVLCQLGGEKMPVPQLLVQSTTTHMPRRDGPYKRWIQYRTRAYGESIILPGRPSNAAREVKQDWLFSRSDGDDGLIQRQFP
jgi:hypothetical protein